MASGRSVLVLNAGSSSLKYALFSTCKKSAGLVSMANGLIDRIGDTLPSITHKIHGTGRKIKHTDASIKNYEKALECSLSLLEESDMQTGIQAVGHRVVHGGEGISSAKVIDSDVLSSIENAIPLAPLHNPANLVAIQTSMKVFPQTTLQVAVFDTAFHSTMPPEAFLYGLPYDLYKQHGVRKYGFHGTSHDYVMRQAADILKKPVSSVNLITCHLGAGSSMSCIKNGQCIDTTMGMTPLEGLIMASRCGDLDASVIFHLTKHFGMNMDDIEAMLNKKSGWYGLSGHKDARDLQDAFESGDQRACITTMAIAHRIRRYLGSFFWNLGGQVDAIVFTAGVGENWPALRKLCLDGTEGLGFTIDAEKNEQAVRQDSISDISGSKSTGRVLVVPTNEELNIAEQTLHFLANE